ncbi:MAG: ATP--guanido phosphotransferase [Firmicutes bacterium]|nr:ATP--guanido phosphotransferase [Bacillota bacterium]
MKEVTVIRRGEAVAFGPWYQSNATDENQIISSRVRLARNLKQYLFQRKLSPSDASAIVLEVENIIGKINVQRPFEPLVVQDLRKIDQQIFLEKHILSPRYLDSTLSKGVFVDVYQNISVMVNEEDHVRIQSVCPGNNLAHALITANEIDNLLEKYLDFAFDEKLGYLTACPTNVGTGLRASYMVHLPCLDKTNMLKKLFPYITKSGMTLRGIYGEGTIPMGSIYQLSNQITLGKNEAQIIKTLAIVADNIIKREIQTRDNILSSRQNYLQDKAYRAYGILSYSRRIAVHEAMNLLSDIRLGYMAGILDLPKLAVPIYQIMMEIQPGHLYFAAGKTMNEDETDTARADFLRKIFYK